MTRTLAFAVFAALAAFALPPGCTQFPELDQAARKEAVQTLPYPVILPLDDLLADAAVSDTTVERALAARAAALRARAAALRAVP